VRRDIAAGHDSAPSFPCHPERSEGSAFGRTQKFGPSQRSDGNLPLSFPAGASMSLSLTPRAGAAFTAAALAILAGCKGAETLGPDKKVASIEINPEGAQLYAVGQQVTFTATITTEAGTPGIGIEVGFIARDPSLIQINSAGVATVMRKGGATYVVAKAQEKSDSALVEVPETTCGSATPTAMTAGQVITDIGDAGFCASASSGEYTVIVHNNSLAGSGASSVEVTGLGVGSPPASSSALLSRASTSRSFLDAFPTRQRDVAAEMRHRRNEALAVAPMAAAARAWYESRAQRASFAAAPPAVGDLMTINVNTSGFNGCTDPRTDVAARVAAVSNYAIVLADPRNPAGGFTDADYAGIAAMFDSVVYPLDVEKFGAPTDLDGNSRVLLVFTRAINERTPANVDYYVGGLTHSRDLIPKSQNCPGSNEAEMFYLLVPDPTGSVNNNVWTTADVLSVTDATVAHEFQHLINFARRRYILPGHPLPGEELWLNEGLSHMAEELLYYRLSGRASRSNLGYTQLFSSQAQFDVFRFYMSGNFLNHDEYIFRTAQSSPFRSGDDVATRGATWMFLRYAADQTRAEDGSIWFDFVNSGDVGVVNFRNRLGGLSESAFKGMLRDFTIAEYADDHVGGVATKYTLPSWNMRSVYQGLNPTFFRFRLDPTPLNDGAKASATLIAGGFAVYRFRGMPGVDSYVRVKGGAGATLPASITVSVIRTQ
jgi:hypothetical protein